ncbi:MAG: ferrous iron transport protein A [Chloroflexi bacterium]|nr:ferrous iron transport protein A [Chloroflexota bacterium]
MVQNYGHGPIIVTVRDTRIALGRGEAGKIWVHPVSS